jgi:hypothetical protein
MRGYFAARPDCFKGIYVNIKLTETQNQIQRPTGCP